MCLQKNRPTVTQKGTKQKRIKIQPNLRKKEDAAAVIPETKGPAPKFLNPEQQTLHRKAKTAFVEFTVDTEGYGSTCKESAEIDGMTYYCCDGLLTTWEDFEKAMTALFTQEYFEELNDLSYTDGSGTYHKRTNFTQQDGALYCSGGARGGDPTFISPETFELISQTEDEIQFYLVANYADFVQQADGTWDHDKENVTQKKKLMVMKKGQDGWRFSQFHLAY